MSTTTPRHNCQQKARLNSLSVTLTEGIAKQNSKKKILFLVGALLGAEVY